MKSIFAVVFTLFNFLLLASAVATPQDRSGGGVDCTQCNPNPNLNKCDITTSCITTQPSGQLHCACRAGYKATSGSSPSQYRLPFAGQTYRVFVAPGVKCDTLCNEWWLGPQSCQEVPVQSKCDP